MIPKTERIVVTYWNTEGEKVAVLTQKQMDGSFLLYEVSGREINRLGKGNSPLALEEKYHIRKRMGISDG